MSADAPPDGRSRPSPFVPSGVTVASRVAPRPGRRGRAPTTRGLVGALLLARARAACGAADDDASAGPAGRRSGSPPTTSPRTRSWSRSTPRRPAAADCRSPSSTASAPARWSRRRCSRASSTSSSTTWARRWRSPVRRTRPADGSPRRCRPLLSRSLDERGVVVLDVSRGRGPERLRGHHRLRAAEHGVGRLSELGRPGARRSSFGGPPECPDRPFCLQGLEDVYGLRLRRGAAACRRAGRPSRR